jgi:glycosyltransferase involved in cell wall biosynthesis
MAVTAPRLSAIVCTYDRYSYLDSAINSLLAQSLAAGELEILVVDNSPDQRAAAEYGARYTHIPHLRYVLEPVAGLSNARNTGLGLARAPVVGFIDDDATAHPGWAAGMLHAFATFEPPAGAVGGPVRPVFASPRPGWLSDSLLGYIGVIDCGPAVVAIPPGETIFGCNMALDKHLAEQLGGFSRQLGRIGSGLTLLSNEETDLFARMRGAGKAIVYTPEALVHHHIDPRRLDQAWFRRRVAWQAVSDYIMEPQATTAQVPAAAEHLRMVEASRARRRGVGFFGQVTDPEAFAAEMQLVRQLMLATLSGGADLLAPDHPPARRGLRRVLRGLLGIRH